ncbi:nuclear receptor 2C2-associated protein [Diaphorina citri]|uniref:Nuclear receptor 2C2-associated protein n=1 Tax=Diaphorina citri TaxID=121845 RepID=A0A1S3CZ09_DIACI|nr:nuclear receptor 2C2-associated protein [Diaphorina citri]
MTFVLTEENATVRVSSVLNKDNKQYGKKFLLDGNDESCWSSDQGSPQWIKLDFKQKFRVVQVELQFQGGFVGKDCHMKFDNDKVVPFYPEDINTLQKFSVPESIEMGSLLLMFNASTDFFGRIVVYQLNVVCES